MNKFTSLSELHRLLGARLGQHREIAWFKSRVLSLEWGEGHDRISLGPPGLLTAMSTK